MARSAATARATASGACAHAPHARCEPQAEATSRPPLARSNDKCSGKDCTAEPQLPQPLCLLDQQFSEDACAEDFQTAACLPGYTYHSGKGVCVSASPPPPSSSCSATPAPNPHTASPSATPAPASPSATPAPNPPTATQTPASVCAPNYFFCPEAKDWSNGGLKGACCDYDSYCYCNKVCGE